MVPNLQLALFSFLRKCFLVCFLFSILYLLVSPDFAFADNNAYILRGVAKILGAAFQLPGQILEKGATEFPFGILTGTVNGVAQTFWGLLSGSLDVAKGAAPYAKYMFFL